MSLLSRAGNEVFAVDVDAAGLERSAQAEGWHPSRVVTRRLDVTDATDVERCFDEAVEHLGHVDVAMHVAGTLKPGWVAELDAAAIDRQVDVNIKGVMHGTRVAAAHMAARGSGHIINVASMAALAPIPGISVYCATKYAVRAFSLCASIELRPKGVAVSVICPDAVDTPMLDLQENYEEAAITFSNKSVLTADDVALAMTGPVLRDRPLEVVLPPSRGWLAKAANLAPRGSELLVPIMQRRGRQFQQKRKRRER